MKQWIQLAGYAIALILLIGAVGLYTYHVWDDCLDENSVLTCLRMLK